jgi:NADPH:quinone reductase-like Zn-dependent oxidoreductase
LTLSVASIDAYMRNCPAQFRTLLAGLAADLASGKLKPSLFETLPLAQGERAHRILESGGSTGKLVFRMDVAAQDA